MSRAARLTAFAAMLLGTLLASIEATIVATAMQDIVDDLGGREIFSWAFSAYILASTVTVPLYGKLADLFGRRRVYAAGIALFVGGSALCGAAPTMPLLIVARAVQGLGAGAIIPLTMTVTGDLFEVRERARLQGLFAVVWGISSVVGPLAGAWVTAASSWRWIFYLNVPFSVLSVTLLALTLREPPARRHVRVDWAGAALLFAGASALLVALLPAAQRAALGPLWPWAAGGVAGLAAFVWHERRTPEPIAPLGLLRDPVQAAANAAGFLLGVCMFAQITFTPLYIEKVLGLRAIDAGQALIPVSLGWSVASFAAGRALVRLGYRPVVRAGALAVLAGSVGVSLRVGLGWAPLFVPALALFGLGMGACITSFTVAVQDRVEHERRGVATALTVFSRSMGGAVGTSVMGAALAWAVAGRPASALGWGVAGLFWATAAAAAGAAAVVWVLFPRAAVRAADAADADAETDAGAETAADADAETHAGDQAGAGARASDDATAEGGASVAPPGPVRHASRT
jgi:EmrB/QacA subfamily drug resistance transporter